MKKLFVIIIGISIALSSCSTEVTKEEIRPMIFDQSRGLISGIDIGDSWEYVKENHPDGWTVREDHTDGISIYQLRKDWEEGYNTMNLTFDLDENEKIREMQFGLILSDDNRSELYEIQKLFISDFNLIMAEDNIDTWKYIGPDGKTYSITLALNELNDKSSNLSVLVLGEL